MGLIRVVPTGSKASRHVRYASNSTTVDASQRTDAMCHNRTHAPQQITRSIWQTQATPRGRRLIGRRLTEIGPFTTEDERTLPKSLISRIE